MVFICIFRELDRLFYSSPRPRIEGTLSYSGNNWHKLSTGFLYLFLQRNRVTVSQTANRGSEKGIKEIHRKWPKKKFNSSERAFNASQSLGLIQGANRQTDARVQDGDRLVEARTKPNSNCNSMVSFLPQHHRLFLLLFSSPQHSIERD